MYGGADGIRLNIDSSSLWDTRPIEKFNREDYTFDELFRLYKGGEEKDADLDGNIMGGWVQYTYSLTSSMWMLLVLDKWCDYTDDKAFLREFMLPALSGSYKLMMDKFLVLRDGKYELLISAAPEINDNQYSAWVKNSTYDISIIKEFLRVYIRRLDEMLLQYHHGILKLFPAIPDEWRGECSFCGLAISRDVFVSAAHRGDAIVCEIECKSLGCDVPVEAFGRLHKLSLKNGKNKFEFMP